MAHDLQVRYADLVLAKLRKELVLKDGVVFNNDYEGAPSAGAIKVPVRDTEVAIRIDTLLAAIERLQSSIKETTYESWSA